MKENLQLEGLNNSTHSRQGEQKCKDPEVERSLDNMGQSIKGAHVAEVAWDGRA